MIRSFKDTYTCTRCKVELEILLNRPPDTVSKVLDFDSRKRFDEAGWNTFGSQGGNTPATLCPECTSDAWSFLHGSEEWVFKDPEKESECCLKHECQKHNVFHGQEAYSLRTEIERLIVSPFNNKSAAVHVHPRRIQKILDETDALDSQTYAEQQSIGDEARRLRQGLEKLLSVSELSNYLNKDNVVYEFNNVPDRESQDYLKQRGGSHEAHCLRTGVAALLSKDSSSNYISKFDIMHLFEEISPNESNFYPRRGYHSDRYRK